MDDLNDLVWSASSQQNSKPSPFQSSFDLLAGSSSSTSTFYNSSTRTVSLQPPPLANSGAVKPSIPQPSSQKSTDAFADLFPLGGATKVTGASSGMRRGGGSSSMAEEQARLREEVARKKEVEHKGFESQGAFWDSLGGEGLAVGESLKASTPLPPSVQRPQQQHQQQQYQQGSIRLGSTSPLVPSRSSTPQISRPIASTSSTNVSSQINPSDVWSEFDLLSSSSKPSPSLSSPMTGQSPNIQSKPSLTLTPPALNSGKTEPASDPFDFFLNQTTTNNNGSSDSKQATAANRAQAPGARGNGEDWEFTGSIREGKERGGLLEGGEEDDFMSAFNQKPIEMKANTSRPTQPTSSSSSRRASPPPHVVGQLVEMGFTPTQARQALNSTESGLDVQMAASMLLSESSNQTGSTDRGFDNHDRDDDDGDDEERDRDRLRLQEEEAAAERRRKRRQGPSRSSVVAGGVSDPSRSATNTPPNEGATTPLQEQAAKILAQTNLLGTSVFNRANAFWKEGKSHVQKAYEERAAAATTAGNSRSSTPANDGRPKWMTESIRGDGGSDEEGPKAQSHSSGFKDEFADEQPQESVLAQRPQKERPANQKSTKVIENPSSLLSTASKIGSLFSMTEDEPKSYVSPNRRPATRQSSSPSTTPSVSRPSPVPAKPLKTRSIPSVSASSIESASTYRTTGNDFFKLGQFGEAEGAYTQAIGFLPDGHPRSIPLYNNRAASRLKNGDHTGSASDSTTVIEMIGLDYHPEKEVPLPSDLSDINLEDGLIKAIVKRANAMELGERWSKGKEDWDLVGKLEIKVPGATKIAAMDGARRCKKMVDVMNGAPNPAATAPPSSASLSSTTKRKPSTKVVSSLSTGAASALLKATTAAAESEDLQRDQHKDAVDARILSWKSGKEANVRALIGSLENVLWPELGWQKVGLHELVTDKQVKIKYTRAVGKVHPDKLNTGNTTVEQRMIANGVFAALNEAWNAGQR